MKKLLQKKYLIFIIPAILLLILLIAAAPGAIYREHHYRSAMNALHQRGLVENEKYREIYLTDEGLRIAKLTAQKHHILQILLHKVMGVDNEQASEDACAIEHVISDESAEKILAFLDERGLSPY